MSRRKKHSPEEIVTKLRQVEVSTGQGTPVADAVRSIGVTEATYYRWRQEFGGLKLDQVRRLKALEAECSATIGIADAPTTMVAGLGEDERVMKRLSWHGGLLK